MNFQWLSFQIDVVSLIEFIQPLMTAYDGLICDSDCFYVSKLTDASVESQITTYLASLTQAGEQAKITGRQTANTNELTTLLNTSWDSLTLAQKQLLLGLN